MIVDEGADGIIKYHTYRDVGKFHHLKEILSPTETTTEPKIKILEPKFKGAQSKKCRLGFTNKPAEFFLC